MRSKSDFQFLFEIVNAYATFPESTVANQIAVQLGIRANAVYHQLVQDNVDESEWPRVIQMYFESELTPGPRSIN